MHEVIAENCDRQQYHTAIYDQIQQLDGSITQLETLFSDITGEPIPETKVAGPEIVPTLQSVLAHSPDEIRRRRMRIDELCEQIRSSLF